VRDRIERLFVAWGHFAYRRAWIVIALGAALVGFLGSALPELRFDTSTEGFFHEQDPVRVLYDRFREHFGQDTRILVVVEPPQVFSLDSLARLRALHEEIEREVPMLVEVTSLVNARETRGDGDELIVGELLEEWPESEAALREVERRVRANPLYRDHLVSADGRLTTLLIETETWSSLSAQTGELGGFDEASAEPAAPEAPQFLTGEENSAIVGALLEVVERHRADDFRIWVAGSPVMVDQLQQSMRRDMSRFTGLSLLAIAVLLGLLFRRVAGVALPLVTVLVSLASTLAVMTLTGTPLTLPTQILPSFLLAVGVGGSVHILAIFYQARRRGETEEDAIAGALGHSGLAVVMTSLTTAGGLLSFVLAELRPISHLGVFGPVGVLVALLFTLALLPALIAVFPMRPEGTAGPRLARTQGVLVACGDFAVRRAGAVVATWAILLALALVGATRISVSHNPLEWFVLGHPLRDAMEVANEGLRGSMFLEFLVRTGQENGLHEPALLRGLDEVARRAADVTLDGGELYVGKTLSLADVVKEIHQALNENRADHYAVPGDRLLVAQELLLFENTGSDDLTDFVDPRFSEARLTMKVPFLDAVRLEPLFQELERLVRDVLGDVQVETTGMAAVLVGTMNAVMRSMLRSYAVALAVITPLMILLIGSLRIGLLSMLPNLAPIALTLGLMGWLGLPLDVFSLMVGSIAIGLAVDDTIHFLHNFRRCYGRSGDVASSVHETLATTGQAMLFTSLVLSSGFFLFCLSSMTNLVNFGLLTGFTIISAFLADLLLSPALLALALRARRAGAAASLEMEASR
jgi:predicted RND superfamily exporter protein